MTAPHADRDHNERPEPYICRHGKTMDEHSCDDHRDHMWSAISAAQRAARRKWDTDLRAEIADPKSERADLRDRLDNAEAEVERLRRWKAEATEVILGLQDVGKALGLRLGERITGASATEAAERLTTRAEAAESALAEERATLTRVEALADDLAATVALLLYDAHPVYGSTATWRGGIGGAATTQGCSFLDPPPDSDWLELGMPSMPLREWINHRGDFDLDAAKERMKGRFRAALAGPAQPADRDTEDGEGRG